MNLGPEIGYCFYDDLGSGIKHPTQQTQYEPLDYPFDWGIAGGAGIYYRHEKYGIWEFEARFCYSLSDLFYNNMHAYFNNSHVMTLSFNLGYYMPIKTKPKKQKTK